MFEGQGEAKALNRGFTLRAESSSIFLKKIGKRGEGLPLPYFSRKIEGDSARIACERRRISGCHLVPPKK